MHSDALLDLFADVVAAVRGALDAMEGEWGLSGLRETQYRHDVVADRVALDVLLKADVCVVSEETGVHNKGRPVTVVVDPVDGSTNASIGLPWYAISLCAMVEGEMFVSRVDNLATGTSFVAVRGEGAMMDGKPIRASGQTSADAAIIAINARPNQPMRTQQFRTLGATALDMCFVAAGRLDGYVDCDSDAVAPWDYLGALLVCAEAGAVCADAQGRELEVTDHDVRRSPIAAATPELLQELLVRRSDGL